MVRGRRAAVVLVALAEIALVAAIVLALAGERFGAAGWADQLPGGRLAVAGAALVLLLVAAIAMTILVSD